MLDRLRAEALGPKGALKVALDDEAFDPAGYLSASARTIAMEPDGRFSLPAEFAGVLEVGDGVMLVGKGDKFQLWNPRPLAGPPRFRSRQDGGLRARPRGRRRMTPPAMSRFSRARSSTPCSRATAAAIVDGTFGAGGYTDGDARSRRLPGDRHRPRSRRHRRRPGACRALCAAAAPDRRPLRRHGRAVGGRGRRGCRRRGARSRRFVDAVRPGRSRLLVPRLRSARHAHGDATVRPPPIW